MLVFSCDFHHDAEVLGRESSEHIGLQLEQAIDKGVHLPVVFELDCLGLVSLAGVAVERRARFCRSLLAAEVRSSIHIVVDL